MHLLKKNQQQILMWKQGALIFEEKISVYFFLVSCNCILISWTFIQKYRTSLTKVEYVFFS